MVQSIQNLMAMEQALYPTLSAGAGVNSACPNFLNGYRGNSIYSPTFRGGYTPSMNGYANPVSNTGSIFANPKKTGTAAAAGAALAANNAIDADINVLADYAIKLNDESETLMGAAMGGLTFAAFENSQNVKHFINSSKSVKLADKIFDIKNNAAIKELWTKEPEIMQNAYSQVHSAYRRMQPKWSGVQKWFAKPLNAEDTKYVTDLIKKIETEVAKGANADKELIAKYTEHLRATRGMDGYIPSAWNKVRQFFGANPGKARNFSASERVARKAIQINGAMQKLSTFAKIGKEFKGWFIFEALIEGATKVIPTYINNGADSGNKQLLQSGVKAFASAGGWAVGRVAGGVLGAKAGAALGTMICPGVGTAIGSVIGFAGGCIGSWLGCKAVKAVMGEEESEKIAKAQQKKQMTSTEEGQAQLLQLVYQKAQEGKAPAYVVNSLNNIFSRA